MTPEQIREGLYQAREAVEELERLRKIARYVVEVSEEGNHERLMLAISGLRHQLGLPSPDQPTKVEP